MPSNKSLLSALTIAAVGLSSRAFLQFLCAEVEVVGLQRILDALDSSRRSPTRGVLTVSNHISVLDDPLAWGVFPASHFLRARPMRWSLGASDMCFTNPLFSAFFRQGQVLDTVRGNGVYQWAVDRAVELLNQGEWVHVFPEGKISQPAHWQLRRLKWGIGRMLIETKQLPTIIPIWLTGFDQVMDERRGFPRFLPRVRKRVSVTFGESKGVEMRVAEALTRVAEGDGHLHECGGEVRRAEVTHVVQEELEQLGKRVSGEVTGNVREGK